MKSKIDALREDFLSELGQAGSLAELDKIKIKFLGRKQGILSNFLKDLPNLNPEERPLAGKLANELKVFIAGELHKKSEILEHESRSEIAGIDVTLPGRYFATGKLHPISTVKKEVESIFLRMGYAIEEGPEIETDYYNFEALNMPRNHPARDMQDTFYISDDHVLRTQTSPVQIRYMEKQKPPLRMISLGKTFRRDWDVTHTPQFYQMEGLAVDRHIHFGHLKGTLIFFLKQLFDKDIQIRFRPSFFPFTEPSAEIDISCILCKGKGCRICSGTGWLEVLGAGMVDPNVFSFVDIDSEEFTGFAFGLGIDRVAVLKYGITDSRMLYENDLRFLRQFP